MPEDSISLMSKIPLCRSKLAERGINVGPYINLGSEGTLFWVGDVDSDRVYKFTISPGEARLAWYLKGNPHHHFPKIYQVLEITQFCSNLEGRVWLIERENLKDLAPNDFTKNFLSALIRGAYQAAPKIDILTTKSRLREIFRESQTKRYDLVASEINQVRTFFRFIVWCAKVGIYLGDLNHLANWGFRPQDGKIVIRDFGKFYFARSTLRKDPLSLI